MAAKVGARVNLVASQEFEPFCKWEREEARDTLIVDLPDFKKEQLRVHINNRGILKISGERSIDESKKSKFYKEVPVARNCNTNGIQAKFANSQLFIIMPKLPADQLVKEQSKPDQNPAIPEENKDQSAAAAPPPQELGSKKLDELQNIASTRGKEVTKMAVNVGLVMALLAAILAFVVYMYKSTIVED